MMDETYETMGEWIVSMSKAKQLGEVCLLPIPNPMAFLHTKRKITLEVVKDPTSITRKKKKKKNGRSLSSSDDHDVDDDVDDDHEDDDHTDALQEGDSVRFRVFKERNRKGSEKNDTVPESTVRGHDDDARHKIWEEHYRYPTSDVIITARDGAKLHLTLGVGQDREYRNIVFQSERETEDFESVWNKMQKRAQKRAIHQLQEYKTTLSKIVVENKDDDEVDDREESVAANVLSSTKNAIDIIEEIKEVDNDGNIEVEAKVDDDEAHQDKAKLHIRLLVDIVRGSNLPAQDPIRGTSNPYVVVYMQEKEVHRTDFVTSDLNPIWTIKTASLFLLEMTAKDFFLSNAMTLIIKDHDALQSNNVIGYVKVPHNDLLFGTGQRKGYVIETYNGIKTRNSDQPPMLYLRFKKATADDMQFVNAYKEHGFGFGLYADEAYWPIQKRFSTTLTRMHKTKGNERKTRVMPEPDPDRSEDETLWLTSEQLQAEALKDSTNWVQAGSGDLGTLYFELIGCDNLPDMDSVVPGDGKAVTCVKIDSFACIVYEDSVVNTEVIPNCSSPRWMPWTYRAFKFQMSHPATDVLLGIFDHDNAYNPAQVISRVIGVSKLHDAVGRVVIELSKLQPDTTYTLKYPLYYGETEEKRKKSQGTVTVRLRMEFPSVRKVMLSALSPPQNNVVALRRKSQWAVAHYTAHGSVDNDKFSIATMTRYIEELEGYIDLWDTIRSALWHIWLWRGHYTVSLGGRTFKLPLHSITAYIWTIKLSWNYDLFPSFILFCIGWTMLASLEQVNRHPSRWNRSPMYTDFLRRLILNTSGKERVSAGENAEQIQRYNEEMEKQQEERKERRKLEQAEQLKIQKEVDARMEEAEKAEKSGFNQTEGFFGLNLRPLKPILYPYQKMMQGYIQTGRMAKNIVLWYESYYAFWLTTIAFVLSAVAFFVPWSFVLTWSFRVIVIVGLGPWMKIVDILCFRADPNLSVSEQEEAFTKRIQARYEATLKSTDFYQIRSERANKLNDMRQFMFGMHLLKVPMLRTDVVFDVPVPASSATPVVHSQGKGTVTSVPVKHRKFGQFLEGDMIPKREVELEAEKARVEEVIGERLLSQGRKVAGTAVGTAVGVPTKLAGNVLGMVQQVGRKALKTD